MLRQSPLRWCSGCEQHLPKEMHFSDRMWKGTNKEERKCNACSQAPCATESKTKKCIKCTKDLTETCFTSKMWRKVGPDERKCVECSTGSQSPNKKGQWLCVRHDCRQTWPVALFSRWMTDKNRTTRNHSQICNQCFMKDRDAETEQNRKTHQQLQQKR